MLVMKNIEVLKTACAWEFVAQFEMEFIEISEGGNRFSEGTKTKYCTNLIIKYSIIA